MMFLPLPAAGRGRNSLSAQPKTCFAPLTDAVAAKPDQDQEG